jgi:AhpC/TSA family
VQGTRSDLTVVLGLLVASLAVNVFFGLRLYAPHRAPAMLANGTMIGSLRVSSLEGKAATLTFGERPTVLYVFSPSCPWCRRNAASVRRLFEAKKDAFRFVGLSLEEKGLASALAEHPLPFPVYTRISSEARTQYHFGAVPQTLVVSERGAVVENWGGAYVGEVKKRVESFFAVDLPDLSAETAEACTTPKHTPPSHATDVRVGSANSGQPPCRRTAITKGRCHEDVQHQAHRTGHGRAGRGNRRFRRAFRARGQLSGQLLSGVRVAPLRCARHGGLHAVGQVRLPGERLGRPLRAVL